MNLKPLNEISRCVTAHTVLAALCVSALAALALATTAQAEPREIPARVVWANGARVYVAARDTGVIEAGLNLTFLDRRRVVASGAVEDMLDGTLASVRLATGSLDRIKRLDRVRVLAANVERRAWPVLRVGVPSGTRENLAIDCAAMSIDLPLAPDLYRVEPLGDDVLRGVKAATNGVAAWPETLIVRRYADAIDEEIALERGELDVAVFWPGEPSARLRGRPLLFGLRSRGVIALEGAASAARGDPRLVSLNAELFGGDLMRLPSPDSAAVVEAFPSITTPRDYTVDLALPGHTRIEHFLNGGASLFQRQKPALIRVTLLDAPTAPPDSLGAAWWTLRPTSLFALRCPIAGPRAALDYVGPLGADAFADLVRCTPRGERP